MDGCMDGCTNGWKTGSLYHTMPEAGATTNAPDKEGIDGIIFFFFFFTRKMYLVTPH